MRDASPAENAELTEYLIEVPHSPEECVTAQFAAGGVRQPSRRTYSGCGDGTHTTWIIAELASENDAWSLVPRLLRDTARVTRIDRGASPDSLEEPKGGST
jgi:hypothetical protein